MSLWGKYDLKPQSNTADATIAVTSGAVVGVNTQLDTDFKVGDFLNVGGNDYVFTIITDATNATVRSGINGGALVDASANGAYVVSEKPMFVVYSEANGDASKIFGVDMSEMAYANTSGTEADGVAHAGWVRRTVGAGGRSGRVQYETLVAGSSITGDAADDTQLPE
jgi:hypothetical protein